MINIMGTKYLTEKEASTRYGQSVHWFQKQRYLKKPPPYVKFQQQGRVYYPLDETDKWFKENLTMFK